MIGHSLVGYHTAQQYSWLQEDILTILYKILYYTAICYSFTFFSRLVSVHLQMVDVFIFFRTVCNTVFTTINAYSKKKKYIKKNSLVSILLLCLPWTLQHLSANYFQSCTEMHTGAHERRALGFELLCVYDISKNIILWQKCLQRKTNVCFWDVFVIFWMQCVILQEMWGILHFVCAILGFVCKVLK